MTRIYANTIFSDYNSTMERKMAGIVRTSDAARAVSYEESPNIAELHLTQKDLLNLIQKQE